MIFPFRDNNPVRRSPLVTYCLVAINVIVFLWFTRLPSRKQQEVVLERGFIPARIGQLAKPEPFIVSVPGEQIRETPFGPVEQPIELRYKIPPDTEGTVISLITCMFLHGGWLHLVGNMWFLWIFGNNVEDRLGPVLYLLFYLTGGLLATGVQWMIDPGSTTPVIGASGAVAAVLGAYAVTWPWARVDSLVFLFIFVTIIQLPALIVLGVWFFLQLVEAFAAFNMGGGSAIQSGVAWWAHVGGFVGGLLMMPPLADLMARLRHEPRRREEPLIPEIID